MKFMKHKKLVTIILLITLISNLILPIYSAELTRTFSAEIVSDTKVDLSGIEIKVYSATPVYDEENKLLFFAETYEYSVYTDSKGEFAFRKPSEYCSYSVNMESLPVEYGVSKHTQFIMPSRNEDTISTTKIAATDVNIDGNNITATFKDADNNIIYTAYEIVPNEDRIVNSSELGEKITNSLNKETNEYSYICSGTIVTNGKEYTYSKECEKFVVASEQYEQDEYATRGDIPTYQAFFDINISASQGGPYCFRVFYQTETIGYNTHKTYLTTLFQSLYSTFIVNNLFTAPSMYIGSDKQYFPVYIVSDYDTTAMSTSALAITRRYGNNNLSTIIIRNRPVIEESEEIIAHEFMHAIMKSYTNWGVTLPNWYTEGFANLASIIFCSEDPDRKLDAITSDIKAYKGNSDKSITSTSGVPDKFCYGTTLYPLYIYSQLGGWYTVRNIFTNYLTYYNSYSGTDYNIPAFSAISSAQQISSYSSAFAAMAAYNYNTGQYYSQYGGDSWGYVKENEYHLNDDFGVSFAQSVNEMATQYEVYDSAGHDMTLTIEITCGNTNGLIYKKICESSTGVTTISTIIHPSDRITVANFGDLDCDRFVLAIVNTIYGNGTIDYTISFSWPR